MGFLAAHPRQSLTHVRHARMHRVWEPHQLRREFVMSLWLWNRLDDAAHFLFCPTALGQRAGQLRWHHRIHLIPGRALAYVCDGYGRALGLPK